MTSTDVWLLLLALILVVFAGLLVSAEAAIGRVSRSRAEELHRESARGAAALVSVIADRARHVNVLFFLSTTFTVTATVLVSFTSYDIANRTWGWGIGWSLVPAVVVMVLVSYVALGVAPRTLGRQHADRIALRSARVVRFLEGIVGPLSNLLILIGNALTPGKGYQQGPFASQAELLELLEQAEHDDLLEGGERRMIASVVELSGTFAKEVMVPRTEIVFIERGRTLRQAQSLGLRSGFSRIPVTGEGSDDIIGIIYLKDVTRRLFEHREAEHLERVESLMRSATFVPDSKPVDELLSDMQAARVHLAVVVDEYGGTAGLITIEDILEEIVGEIADEHDTSDPEVTELPNGSLRVSSRLHIEDLGERIGVEFDAEQEGVDTVLGYIAKQMGRVPIPGASIEVGDWTLTAERGAGRRNRIGTVFAERRGTEEELAGQDSSS